MEEKYLISVFFRGFVEFGDSQTTLLHVFLGVKRFENRSEDPKGSMAALQGKWR